ncbi:MAG: aspartate kinase [Candidatus Caldarchaeum sp.]|nr:aspartate kinase [Candidatus Caldarchaeum sp.]MCS7134209.1 aspartate kinase [Candidatus Caldarchaeum sp.]MDW8435078.1 aspartate kinase [Candidatus Caldarchaeum sp.]
MRIVMKFGGSSLASADLIKHCASIVKQHAENNEIVVVCSASGDTTDDLLALVETARRGRGEEVERRLSTLEQKHLNLLDAVTDDRIREETSETLKQWLRELRRATLGILYLREATPRSTDYVVSFGERFSTLVMAAALNSYGLKAQYLDGGEAGIVTDSNFGGATPLIEVTRLNVRRRIGRMLDEGVTPTVTGFIATNEEGVTTTLGRGGSDYTATILASSLPADEVWLWSDVDGLMTANPKLIADAVVIKKLSYNEAIEMALFGAKGLHPRALEPVMAAQIPVKIKNTFNPSAEGTLISESTEKTDKPVKAVLLVNDTAMLTVRGPSMVGEPGTAAKILETLYRAGVNVMMISQSISESSISLVIKRSALNKAVTALEKALLGTRIVAAVEPEEDIVVIAVVGEGMKGTPGVASRVFGAVASKGINVKMIAQGSSELNISFAVKESDGIEAVKAIHSEYQLGKT